MRLNLNELAKTVFGRAVYDENGALALAWAMSGFAVRVRASHIVLHFSPDYSHDQPAYVKVTLDGVSSKHAISTGREKIVLRAHPDAVHTLELRRISSGPASLKAAALELDGEVMTPPEAPSLRLQFFGDSITCGYGNLAESTSRVYYTYEEDASETYAARTAATLNADMRAVAISGQGIVKNCNGDVDTPIPLFCAWETRQGRESHDFASWQPHAVVINAGTNDAGGRVEPEEFRDGATAFLAHLRKVYPDAHIFWAYGMMGMKYDDVLSALIGECGDEKIHYVPIRPIYEFEGECGANGHPNLRGHERAAKILTENLKKWLNL